MAFGTVEEVWQWLGLRTGIVGSWQWDWCRVYMDAEFLISGNRMTSSV